MAVDPCNGRRCGFSCRFRATLAVQYLPEVDTWKRFLQYRGFSAVERQSYSDHHCGHHRDISFCKVRSRRHRTDRPRLRHRRGGPVHLHGSCSVISIGHDWSVRCSTRGTGLNLLNLNGANRAGSPSWDRLPWRQLKVKPLPDIKGAGYGNGHATWLFISSGLVFNYFGQGA